MIYIVLVVVIVIIIIIKINFIYIIYLYLYLKFYDNLLKILFNIVYNLNKTNIHHICNIKFQELKILFTRNCTNCCKKNVISN